LLAILESSPEAVSNTSLAKDLGTQGGLAPDLDSAIAQFLDGDVQEAAGAAFFEFC